MIDVEGNTIDEIKKDDLRDPTSTITKSILFIYSMETFISYNLNLAERNGDVSKVKSFGPFACALGEISLLA